MAAGAVLGVGTTHTPPNVTFAALVILAALGTAVFGLNRLAARADERLGAGDASYRAFFEHAIEGIFRTTPEGRYLDVNPALARIYGYANPAALKNGLTDIADQLYVDPKRRLEFQALMQANDQVTDFDSEIRRRDGSIIWISENARAVRDWTGRIVAYEGTVEDVTAQYAAQRALRRALSGAEEASRAKSAFLAAMSHELKTPAQRRTGLFRDHGKRDARADHAAGLSRLCQRHPRQRHAAARHHQRRARRRATLRRRHHAQCAALFGCGAGRRGADHGADRDRRPARGRHRDP
ncbi:MAG: PAS domain S-box protein [Rhizomicrobium sp.]